MQHDADHHREDCDLPARPSNAAAFSRGQRLGIASHFGHKLAVFVQRAKKPAGLITGGLIVFAAVSFALTRLNVTTSRSVDRGAPAGKQRTLTFSRDERLLLIAAADLPTSKVHARRLKALLYHLETTSGSKGCFPDQETLAAKMGVTDRTIRNLIRRAVELKLLTTGRRGRRQLLYYPSWPALRQFCTAEDLAQIEAAVAVDDQGRTARTLGRSFRSRGTTESPEIFSAQDENFPVTSGNHFRSRAETISARSIRSYSNLPSAAEKVFLELVDEVATCEVDQAEPAVNTALAAGCSPDEIRAAIAHYRTLAGVKPGALYVKLCKMQPGEAANRRFPHADQRTANRRHALQVELQRMEDADRDADTAARERQEREQLEAAHGRELDALTMADRLQLVEQTGSSGLLCEFRRKPSSSLVRFELLRMLRSREAVRS